MIYSHHTPAVPLDGQSRRPRVLVVDDHKDSANAIVRLLQVEGYDAVASYGYVDALTRCRESSFDILVTDVQLRDGDGLQMLDSLRDHLPCPSAAIAISGSDDPDEISRAHLAGFDDYLVKPFPVTSLLATLARSAPHN